MAHTSDHARRLVRELERELRADPDARWRILGEEKYTDPGFADRFLQLAEDLISREPRAGLEVARLLPRFVWTVTVEGPRGHQERLERLVRAHGLVGAGYRAVGQPREAERRYRLALSICNRRHLSPACQGELYIKWATLRNLQGRPAEALQFADDAVCIFEAENNEEWIGHAWVARGLAYAHALRFTDAIDTLSEVLGKHYGKLTRHVKLSASATLAISVLELEDPKELTAARVHLRRARKLAGPRLSVPKCILFWVEAKACIQSGSTDEGERLYKKAQAGFDKFGAPFEYARVALDRSALLRFARRWPELEQLAADTFRRFRQLEADSEALAALRLWLDAVEARQLTEELINDVGSKLEERACRHRPPTRRRRRKRKRRR